MQVRLDEMVLRTQQYLNSIYSGNANWIRIGEDGKTGWGTIRGLIRALQIETGISTPNGTFGPATEAACPTLRKDLNPSEKTKRLNYILQGAMWCKGFSPGGFTGIFGDGTEAGVKKFQTSAGLEGTKVNGIADPMIFKALLNMDAYVLVSSGDAKIREIQMCLNRDYHKWIGLRPTDGRYGKDTNKALIYAIQVEEGITEPNGTFGPQTQSKLPVLAPGSKNTPFVKIMQYALYCNRFDPTGFTGVFGNGTLASLKKFQAFCMLTADGYCGLGTWSSLLVSCGDKNRKGTACDCSQEVTDARAKTLINNGYKIVGRYIAGGDWKRLKKDEAQVIFKNGLRLFPIYQKSGNSARYFNSKQGEIDGFEAVSSALDYGFPTGTTIYFAVDFDAVDDEVTSNILPYFKAVKRAMDLSNPRRYKIGVYGARNICSRVGNVGISSTSFVGDMSTGFSGNLGYPLPEDWAFDQIKEYTIGSGEGAIAIDNNIASGRDNGVDNLKPLSPDEIPCNEKKVIEYLKNIGLLFKSELEFIKLDQKVTVGVPSLVPYVKVEAELSYSEVLVGLQQVINFSDPKTFTTSLINAASGAEVEIESSVKFEDALNLTISKLGVAQSIGNVKYKVECNLEGVLTIMLENSEPIPPQLCGDKANAYQRLYIEIHPNKFGTRGLLLMPLAVENQADVSTESSNNGWVLDNKGILVTAGLALASMFIFKNPSIMPEGIGMLITKLQGLFMLLNELLPVSDNEFE